MKEVEVKIKNIDKKSTIEKIEKLGAKKIFTGRVVDYRFDTPDRDLSRLGKALRIRQKGKYVFLNVKGKKKSIENITGRDEIGVKISNLYTMKRILNELGYIKIFELSKYRTEYRLNDVTFDIDEYPGLDPLLEIESDNYEKVEEYIDKLDIDEESMGRIYIREILAAKKKYDSNRKRRFEANRKIVEKKEIDEVDDLDVDDMD
ncbi:MAG: class IV adenylate cyclase [Nanoarchaeota archaeon]